MSRRKVLSVRPDLLIRTVLTLHINPGSLPVKKLRNQRFRAMLWTFRLRLVLPAIHINPNCMGMLHHP